MKLDDPIYYFVFQEHTAFIPLRYVYPECFVLIEDEPQLTPLICLSGPCHRNQNCGSSLAKRVHYIFNEVLPTAEVLVAYFRHESRPGSIMAVILTSDFEEPRVITCNKSAFKKFQGEAISYKWDPPLDYWLLSSSVKDIVPVENLIRE